MPTSRAPSVTTLGSERYLARAARARWSRDRVFFQIEELNALVAPLLARAPADERAARLARARVRAGAIRTAASWVPETTAAEAWAYLATEVGGPEDVFGPALLLKGLAPDAPRTRALLAGVPPALGRFIDEVS